MSRNRVVSRLFRAASRSLGFIAQAPFMWREPKVSAAPNISHGQWLSFLINNFDHPGVEILEIGSRNVTGLSPRSIFHQANYTGFDFYNGENVDVIGDAHRLSKYFPEGKKFDLIFCNAVLEHLHMPWVAATQIHKLLRLGGHVFVETHFSFPSHERPWHFFHFTDMGLRALFNKGLGFEIVESGMCNPLVGHFRRGACPHLRYRPLLEMYAHSEILARKVREVEDFSWDTPKLDQVVGDTRYPESSKRPEGGKQRVQP